jgi:hypothetical protein
LPSSSAVTSVVALRHHLAGRLVDDVLGDDGAHQLLFLDRDALDLELLDLADHRLGELPVLLDDHLTGLGVLQSRAARCPSRSSRLTSLA